MLSFGFTRDVLFLRNEKKPDYLLCAFDRSEPTFRDRIYPAYKANRAPMPDDLRPQIPLIVQMLEAMRVPVLSKEGYEADDVIATVARAAAERGLDVSICTSDKDCRQLIGDRVCIYNLRKKEAMDREALLREWSITPEQVVDLQALVGDSVDNIPGVPGIGIKTAAKMLQEFGTLDNLLGQRGSSFRRQSERKPSRLGSESGPEPPAPAAGVRCAHRNGLGRLAAATARRPPRAGSLPRMGISSVRRTNSSRVSSPAGAPKGVLPVEPGPGRSPAPMEPRRGQAGRRPTTWSTQRRSSMRFSNDCFR